MLKNIIFLFTFFLFFESIFFILLIKYFKINNVAIYLIAFLSLLSYSFFTYQFFNFDRATGATHSLYWSFGFLLLHLIPKIIAIVFWGISALLIMLPSNILNLEGSSSRKSFIKNLGLGIAAIPFTSILYGIFKGKYNFKVIKTAIDFADLPAEFDGFKILQISDLHSGSFDNEEKIQYAVDLINEQDFDLCLFTGDIVNTRASEFLPWIDTFKGIKNPEYGKFSVLGNHDYGEYIDWPSYEEKEANFKEIKGLHDQIDFDLLNNEHRVLKKGSSAIALVGVENWGKKFKKAGDLAKASNGLSSSDFKVLMSHDPSHWEYEVKDHEKNFQLTLSGHTHGLQFGIEIPGFIKWSPVQYVYKQWAGLYKHLNRHVYVNRGFGFHAFPGRVGIWPEISVIELKQKES